MKLSISILFAVLCILLSGCLSPKQYRYSYNAKNISPAFSVIDSRPEVEKQSKLLSYFIANKSYGVYRIGDPELIPDRILYLTEMLSEKCGNMLEGENVEIKRFDILNNQKTYLEGMSMGIAGIPHGGGNVWIEVFLEMDIGSNSYSSESIEYYDISSIPKGAIVPIGPEIQLAIDDAITKIVAQLKGTKQVTTK